MALATMVTSPKGGEKYALGGVESIHILKRSVGLRLGEEGEKTLLPQPGAVGWLLG